MQIPGYRIEPELRVDRADTTNGIGGGILIYVKCDQTILLCDKIVEFNQYCKFKLKLIGKNNQLEIISIYRPPKSGHDNDARLCEIIDAASDKCIVVGDFNFPGIDWLNKKVNGKGNGFMQTCEDNQLDQLVDFPTHVGVIRLI